MPQNILYSRQPASVQWTQPMNVSMTERENSRVLLIVAPADAKEKVMTIAKKYCEMFEQEAVLVLTSTGEAIFVGDEQ